MGDNVEMSNIDESKGDYFTDGRNTCFVRDLKGMPLIQSIGTLQAVFVDRRNLGGVRCF
jgi:hypothetical protein